MAKQVKQWKNIRKVAPLPHDAVNKPVMTITIDFEKRVMTINENEIVEYNWSQYVFEMYVEGRDISAEQFQCTYFPLEGGRPLPPIERTDDEPETGKMKRSKKQ